MNLRGSTEQGGHVKTGRRGTNDVIFELKIKSLKKSQNIFSLWMFKEEKFKIIATFLINNVNIITYNNPLSF